MDITVEHLLKQVDARKMELIDLLSKLIEYNTSAPPARNTKDAQNFIADYLHRMGFEIDMWDVYPNDPNVVGVKKGIKSTTHNSLIINGHIDVAEAREDEVWKTNPFEPIIEEDRIIGRGAADMKGGLASALFATKLLNEADIELPGDLIFQSVIGEEVGEAGTLQCCERGYNADFALVVDTSDLHIQGQGGVITGWITVKNPRTFHDAMRRNMIHAGGGLPEASAIEKMMKVIEGLQELERYWAVTKQYEGYPAGTNTINPAVIEGGRHAAFIADECRLWITVHYYPNETHEQVSKEIEDYILRIAKADPWLCHHPPTFEWGGTSMIEERGEIFPSLEVDKNYTAVHALAASHEMVHDSKVVIDVSPSVTDGGWFGHMGIPAAIYGPGEFRHAHAVNEEVSIQQLLQFTKTMIQFIYEWTNQRKTKS
ncbi:MULTISPECIES: acetylornithine deacetylase [unclassified Oceanobacillus]|uniref:acetylornithine deacetylase n=1 Tax=unclassified Oceanobacillus TaxID=2630292 RepID=UPI0012EBB680|nr:acetylornithine deacetylase [Oceanobacillus sp. AG]